MTTSPSPLSPTDLDAHIDLAKRIFVHLVGDGEDCGGSFQKEHVAAYSFDLAVAFIKTQKKFVAFNVKSHEELARRAALPAQEIGP